MNNHVIQCRKIGDDRWWFYSGYGSMKLLKDDLEIINKSKFYEFRVEPEREDE